MNECLTLLMCSSYYLYRLRLDNKMESLSEGVVACSEYVNHRIDYCHHFTTPSSNSDLRHPQLVAFDLE